MGTHKDVELKVLASVCAYFEQLGPEAKHRCLAYLNDRYGAEVEGYDSGRGFALPASDEGGVGQ